MPTEQADVDAIDRVLARGVAEVQVGNERVKFHSPAELRRERAEREAKQRGENQQQFRKVLPVMTRGLD